jgi:uncharacterized membrane protein
MREAMLIIHFLGLAMGLGTSFGYMFLGIAGSRLKKEEEKKFTINTFSLSNMGHIGIVLLILSGGYLMTPYWASLMDRPLLIAKLALVILLVILILMLNSAASKAKSGDFEKQMKKTETLGKISMFTTISIVVLAVLNFR